MMLAELPVSVVQGSRPFKEIHLRRQENWDMALSLDLNAADNQSVQKEVVDELHKSCT